MRCVSKYYEHQVSKQCGNQPIFDPYLANDLRRFSVVDRPEVLLHGRIIVAFLVKKITILAIDGILLQRIDSGLLRQIDGENVKIALIKNFEFLLQTLLPIAQYLYEVNGIPKSDMISQTFPSVVTRNKSPHSMKMCFTPAANASLCAMNLRSVSSKVNVVVPNISSAGLTPYRRSGSVFEEPALGGHTKAT